MILFKSAFATAIACAGWLVVYCTAGVPARDAPAVQEGDFSIINDCQCPVCCFEFNIASQSQAEATLMYCPHSGRHAFHALCLLRALAEDMRCPVCRLCSKAPVKQLLITPALAVNLELMLRISELSVQAAAQLLALLELLPHEYMLLRKAIADAKDQNMQKLMPALDSRFAQYMHPAEFKEYLERSPESIVSKKIFKRAVTAEFLRSTCATTVQRMLKALLADSTADSFELEIKLGVFLRSLLLGPHAGLVKSDAWIYDTVMELVRNERCGLLVCLMRSSLFLRDIKKNGKLQSIIKCYMHSKNLCVNTFSTLWVFILGSMGPGECELEDVCGWILKKLRLDYGFDNSAILIGCEMIDVVRRSAQSPGIKDTAYWSKVLSGIPSNYPLKHTIHAILGPQIWDCMPFQDISFSKPLAAMPYFLETGLVETLRNITSQDDFIVIFLALLGSCPSGSLLFLYNLLPAAFTTPDADLAVMQHLVSGLEYTCALSHSIMMARRRRFGPQHLKKLLNVMIKENSCSEDSNVTRFIEYSGMVLMQMPLVIAGSVLVDRSWISEKRMHIYRMCCANICAAGHHIFTGLKDQPSRQYFYRAFNRLNFYWGIAYLRKYFGAYARDKAIREIAFEAMAQTCSGALAGVDARILPAAVRWKGIIKLLRLRQRKCKSTRAIQAVIDACYSRSHRNSLRKKQVSKIAECLCDDSAGVMCLDVFLMAMKSRRLVNYAKIEIFKKITKMKISIQDLDLLNGMGFNFMLVNGELRHRNVLRHWRNRIVPNRPAPSDIKIIRQMPTYRLLMLLRDKLAGDS